MNRRLLVATLIAAASMGTLAQTATAGPAVKASNGRAACAWLLQEGVCVSNPFNDLPDTPTVTVPGLP